MALRAQLLAPRIQAAPSGSCDPSQKNPAKNGRVFSVLSMGLRAQSGCRAEWEQSSFGESYPKLTYGWERAQADSQQGRLLLLSPSESDL